MANADIIRSPVKEIVLAPEEGELKIDLRGDLAGILEVSLKTKIPVTRVGGTASCSDCGSLLPSELAIEKLSSSCL